MNYARRYGRFQTVLKKGFAFPREFYFFLSAALLLFFYFELFRLGMVWRNWDNAQEASLRELFYCFYVGARFDFATVCYLAIPCLIFGYLPWVFRTSKTVSYKRFFWGVFTVFLSSLFFLLLMEYEFFREFQTRYNQLAFQYLDEADTVAGIIWYGYPVFTYVFCWLVILAFFFGILYFLHRKLISLTLTPTKKEAFVSLVLLVCLVVLGARGGFGRIPLRWGDAFFSNTNEFVNQMSLNGLYTLGQSLLDVYKRAGRNELWKEKLSEEDAIARARKLLLEPGERFLAEDFNTVSRVQEKFANTVSLKKGLTPPNVVLVLMESFSARVVGACGSPVDCTPAFDKLCEEGILFDHAFSSGTHTHQGIFSSTLGFPNLPGYEYLMKEMTANQPFTSIPSVLKNQGYQTLLFYNSRLSYDNLFGFFRSQGIDHFTGKDDFTDPSVFKDKVWGVSDQTLFEKANEDLEVASKKGPFFSLIITLSNHAPYDLPKPLPFEASTQYGDDNKRFDGVRYADWAIGQFIESAKKKTYFKNTLFVFVGDHGFHIQPVLTETHLLYHHVPLLFYAPELLTEKNVIRHEIVSQTSIAPSILGLLELSVGHAYWGFNLFSSHFNAQKAFVTFKGSGNSRSIAWMRENTLLVYGKNKQWSTWNYDIGFPPSCVPQEIDPEKLKQMQQDLMALVQTATKDLVSHKVGLPPSEDK